MTSLSNSIRGTVHGVVGASRHLLWYMSWQMGAPNGVRELVAKRSA